MGTLTDRALTAARALMGIAAHTATGHQRTAIDESVVEAIRKANGGNLDPIPRTPLRWYQSDLETAQHMADAGDLSRVGQLCRAMRRDGTMQGLLKTRTSGLVALPKRWRGRAAIVSALSAETGTRSLFDEMFPPSELALLAADGLTVGVGIGELVPVVGRDYPVLIRHDPEHLRYRHNEGRWYFQSLAGPIPIVPGDGRWILHTPGGRLHPWQFGLWPALGRAYIDKSHALLHRGNYSGKLANPARVAHAPAGATEEQRAGFLTQLIRWGVNAVFELPVGWEVSLVESNGRGYEVFKQQIESADLETMIILAGQVVTVTGGTGFANADIHQTIRADLIQETADGLAHTINTQGIPPWVIEHYGVDALAETPRLAWDTAPPEDQETEAKAIESLGKAIAEANKALAAYDLQVDAEQIVARFGLPTKRAPEPTPEIEDGTEENSDDSDA